MSEFGDQGYCFFAPKDSKASLITDLADQGWSRLVCNKPASETATRLLPDAFTLIDYRDRGAFIQGDSESGKAISSREEEILSGLTRRLEAAASSGLNRLVVMPMGGSYSPDWPISSRTNSEAKVYNALREAWLNVNVVHRDQLDNREIATLPLLSSEKPDYFMVTSWKNT